MIKVYCLNERNPGFCALLRLLLLKSALEVYKYRARKGRFARVIPVDH